jgi:hypothetical protein
MWWELLDASKGTRSPLGHDCLPLVLQQGVDSLQTACNLLRTSKAMREAVLAHCSVPLKFRPSEYCALAAAMPLCKALITWYDLL